MTANPNGTTGEFTKPEDPPASGGGYRELGHGKMTP
jgi:hypothetical protein